jgi:type I restriction-modification system DNA methylase subunit
MTPPPRSLRAQHIEREFWEAIERVRTQLEPDTLKQMALGLAFLRYLSELFTRRRSSLLEGMQDTRSVFFCATEGQREALLERREFYESAHVTFVPKEARWARLRSASRQSNLRHLIDTAVAVLAKENPNLAGAFPRNYARPELKRNTLLELMSIVDQAGDEGDSRPSEALKVICDGFAPLHLVTSAERPLISLQVDPAAQFGRDGPPFNELLTRLDGQLKELDRLVKHSQQLRTKGRQSGG